MITCICHNVSDKKIKAILNEHNCSIKNLKDLKKHIPICQQCGKCKDEVKELIKQYINTNCSN